MTDDERLVDPLAAARALPRGSMVIVRSRDAARRRELIFDLKALARTRHLKILAAGDSVLATQVDGIHLPSARAHEAAHWRALHPNWIITAAAHLTSMRSRYTDALLLSPVFPTDSHPGAAHIGVARARLIARALRVPVYALGGVDTVKAESLRGFVGIAAISALA